MGFNFPFCHSAPQFLSSPAVEQIIAHIHPCIQFVHVPCHAQCVLVLSAECIDIIQVTTLIAIIAGNRAGRPREEQSPERQGSPLAGCPLLCTSKRWAAMSEVSEKRVEVACEGSKVSICVSPGPRHDVATCKSSVQLLHLEETCAFLFMLPPVLSWGIRVTMSRQKDHADHRQLNNDSWCFCH